MAYFYADTGAKVGFRPYYQTDPFGAAHLSGYGSGLGQNHPFKPQAWHLHGMDGSFLGTYHLNRPFDPWELYADVHDTAGVSGLGYFGDASGNAGTDQAVAQAADELLAEGHISPAEHGAILDGSMSFKDVLGFDPTDQGSWLDAVGLLRSWNSDLQAIEAEVTDANNQRLQSGGQPTPDFTALTAQVQQHRVEYNSLAQRFIDAYRVVTGSVPEGLSGLGIAPIIAWAIGAAAVIAAVYFGYQAFKTWQASIDVKRIAAETASTQQQSSSATNQQLLQRLAEAQAKGDTVTAQAILKTLAVTGAQPGATEKWFMDNAKWLALGAAGLIVVGPIASGLFGRRR